MRARKLFTSWKHALPFPLVKTLHNGDLDWGFSSIKFQIEFLKTREGKKRKKMIFVLLKVVLLKLPPPPPKSLISLELIVLNPNPLLGSMTSISREVLVKCAIIMLIPGAFFAFVLNPILWAMLCSAFLAGKELDFIGTDQSFYPQCCIWMFRIISIKANKFSFGFRSEVPRFLCCLQVTITACSVEWYEKTHLNQNYFFHPNSYIFGSLFTFWISKVFISRV